jgi:hypothetical protein
VSAVVVTGTVVEVVAVMFIPGGVVGVVARVVGDAEVAFVVAVDVALLHDAAINDNAINPEQSARLQLTLCGSRRFIISPCVVGYFRKQ